MNEQEILKMEPPMGDYRWVLNRNLEFELSYITKNGTLVIPRPYQTDTSKRIDLFHKIAKLHGLNPKNISGIKCWGSLFAVHFSK